MESNVLKMKSALVAASTCLKVCCWEDGVNMAGVESIKKEIDDAIEIPLRNCDVGNVSEQCKRHRIMCKKKDGNCGKYDKYSNPCARCFAEWSQQIYKEGEFI